MRNELYNNFEKSLDQKYNAICFDIDGTLTIKNSNSIDKKYDCRAFKEENTCCIYNWPW